MELDANTVVLMLSVAATIITAIASFRGSEKSSKYEGIRTDLEVQRFEQDAHFNQVVQGSQTVNSMATSLLDYTQNRLREIEMAKVDLERTNDVLSRDNIELTMNMRQMVRLTNGLNKILELDNLPNGSRDRLMRMMELTSDLQNKGILQ